MRYLRRSKGRARPTPIMCGAVITYAIGNLRKLPYTTTQ